MEPARAHARFVAIFAAAAAAVLLPVVALNYLLGLRSLGGNAAALDASAWQRTTRGVTYSPPLSDNRPFKSARLVDRLPELNTVVFGSSTAMGITQELFPASMRVYNFAQTGNPLQTVIAEAEFLQQRKSWLKWLVIPLDWSVGFVYQPGAPGREEIAAPVAGAPQRPSVPFVQQLRDAMSLPRVRNLLGIFGSIARAPSPPAAFRQMFLQDSSDDYRCADGTPAKDYDTIFRGTCTGFRFDGSATFGNLETVPARRAEVLIAGAVVASSKYAVALIQSAGEPNRVMLDRIGELAREMRLRGGDVILLLPPLLPGLERALLNAPHTAAPLLHTKEALERWARANNLAIIDAGQSERYGCTVGEFVDEHHALPVCYASIFGRYWRDREAPARMRAGLWVGQQ